MIVDSSALIAILDEEHDSLVMSTAMERAATASISTATLLETSIVAGRQRWAALDALVGELDVVAFDRDQLDVARDAYVRYGKGSGSPARLNLGDCFSYALAKSLRAPLLYKGTDFARTDVASALAP